MKRFALLAMVMGMVLLGCGPTTLVVGVSPGDQRLQSTCVIRGRGWSPPRVAMIDLTGLLMSTNRPGLLSQGDNPLSDLAEKLQAAQRDARVKAVVLRINSPGGTVTASDAMYRELRRFKQESGKPVIVLMMDVAASGGYYVACAGDHLIAYPTTITGSIGVIAQTISFKAGLDMIGIRSEAFTSGPNKDAGSPLASMNDSHRQVFRAMIDDFYARFVQVVKTSRPQIPADRFAWVTDGRIVTGEQALACGLVDELGDLRLAFAVAQQRAEIQGAELILYHRPLRHVGSPYALAASPPTHTHGGAFTGAVTGMAGIPGVGVIPGVTFDRVQIPLPESWSGLGGGSIGFYYLMGGM